MLSYVKRPVPAAVREPVHDGLLDERDPPLGVGEAIFVEVRARDVEQDVVKIGRGAERFERGARGLEVGACPRIIEREIVAKASRPFEERVEERFRAIYDGTYEYIGLLAPDGTLLEANRASLEFAGNTREDVVGKPFWATPWFTPTPGAPEFVRQGVARAAAGEFVRYEATLRRPSGEWTTFDISLHPIRNERGEVILIVP